LPLARWQLMHHVRHVIFTALTTQRRRAFALRNWGIDPVKLLEDPEKRKQLAKAMEIYKDKKYNKATKNT